MGAADHRALPGRASGRRARRVPACPGDARRRARTRPWSRAPGARTADPELTTNGWPARRPPSPSTVERSEGNLPALAVRARRTRPETAAVADLVREHRLVEVVGPGGVGKTALALAVGRRLTCPGGVWFVRLESASTAAEVVDATVAALGVAGGEAALVERLKVSPAAARSSTTANTCSPRPRDWVVRLLDAAPDVRIVCTSQAPLDIAGLDGCSSSRRSSVDDAVTLFTERSADHRSPRVDRPGGRRRPSAVSGARRAPAGDRVGRGAHPHAVGRGDHAASRRSLRRVERPHESPTRASPRAAGDHRLELRPAVPRRPTRACGRWPTFAGGAAAAGGRVRARGARCAGVGHDRRDRPAGWRARCWSSTTTTLGTRYRLLDSIRAFALDAMRRSRTVGARPRRRTPMVRRRVAGLDRGRAQLAPGRAPRLRERRARQHRRRARLVGRARPAAGAGDGDRVRVGVGRARRQPRSAAAADRDRRGRGRGRPDAARRGAAARRLDRGIHRCISSPHAVTCSKQRRSPRRSATSSCRPGPPTTSPTSSRTTATSEKGWR